MAEPQLQFTIPRPNTPVLKPNGQMRDEWFNFLVAITTNVIAAGGTVTHTGALVLNRLVVGNGLDDIRAVAGADGQIPIAATSDGTVQFQNITGTLPVVVTNSPHGIAISAPTSVTGAAGANTDIQYNDGGAFGGDANLTWDKTKQVATVTSLVDGTESAVVAKTSNGGEVTLHPVSPSYVDLTLGQIVMGNNYVPTDVSAAFMWESAGGNDEVGLEVNTGLTAGTPNPFANGVGVSVTGAGAATDPATIIGYDYGMGTGPVPGVSVIAERNADGSGAAGTLGVEQRGGTRAYIWQDATGAMRYGPARPTEDNSVSDTSGSLFGAGLSAAQVAARVAVGV